jgi:GT2 family glycosyltransferase
VSCPPTISTVIRCGWRGSSRRIPHLYAPAAQVVVWIDSNVVIRGDLGPLLRAFVDSGRPVGAIPHPERTNLAEESRECIRRRKDDATVIREQMARYDAVRFETDALVESNLVLLRMDMPQTRRFLSCWWAEIDRGSRRDQLSFNYAARQAGIDLFEITQRPDSVRNHPLLAYLHHDANPASEKGAVSGSAAQSFATVRDTRIAAQADAEADIVICVHDALDAVKACLDSVVASRNPLRHRIIIVDDASSAPTAEHLRTFAEAEDRVLLLRNETALRYTRAANAGLRASTAPLVILLNSDTVVGPNFVEKLADAAATTEGVGIVGPLSNAAGMQSLPSIDGSGGRSPNNALPGGFSVVDMDRWCEAHSPSAFPRVPLVHGFCFAITRAAIEAVGLFDEDRFPQGYGEEDDLCLRAAAHGVGLALATNTFVFHSGSKSYGQEQRSALLANARQQLVDAFGDRRLYRSVVNMQDNPLLKTMRAEAARIGTRR